MPGKKQKTEKEADEVQQNLAKSAFFASWAAAAAKQAREQAQEQNSAAAAEAGSTPNEKILNNVPAPVQQNIPSAATASFSEAHGNDFDYLNEFEAGDEGSVASCDEMDDESVESAISRPTSRARTTTNGNDNAISSELESAFGDADAATTGTARRGRPPTPPVLRIGPAINDISLQRLGKSCPVVKSHFDAASNKACDAIKSAVIDVTSETARYLIDRPKNRGKTAHVYAVLYKSNHSLKKFGLTRCLDERIKVEYEKDDSVYVVSVFNFDASTNHSELPAMLDRRQIQPLS